MALLRFYQTDTASADAIQAWGTGLTSIAPTYALQATLSNTSPGSAANTVGGASNTAQSNKYEIQFETAPNSLNGYIGANGANNASVSLDITGTSTIWTWESCYIIQVNAAGVQTATLGSATGLGISLSTTGLKVANVSCSGPTITSGDKILALLAFSSLGGNFNGFVFTSDSNFDVPLLGPTLEEEAGITFGIRTEW